MFFVFLCMKKAKSMSAFTIYAIILTGIYIIYYSVQMMLDVLGKKNQKKDSAEVFETEDAVADDEDSGVIITETPNGYCKGEDTSAAAVSDNFQKTDNPQKSEDTADNASAASPTPAEEEKQRDHTLVQEQLNPVQVSYQEEYNADAFIEAMSQPLSSKTHIFQMPVSI